MLLSAVVGEAAAVVLVPVAVAALGFGVGGIVAGAPAALASYLLLTITLKHMHV